MGLAHYQLSASAIVDFLRSPKSYYWRHVFVHPDYPGTRGIELIQPSTLRYDHEKIAGQIWAEVIHQFYGKISLDKNLALAVDSWESRTEGWVEAKERARLKQALMGLTQYYYETFNSGDGARFCDASEIWFETSEFIARLDGLGNGNNVHECKMTSRAPNLSAQVWKYQDSIQAKLYAVLAKADGVLIELAFKDEPYTVFRAPIRKVSSEDREQWAAELRDLARFILGCRSFPCNPDGCCIVGKRFIGMCPYQQLCKQGPTPELLKESKGRTHGQ